MIVEYFFHAIVHTSKVSLIGIFTIIYGNHLVPLNSPLNFLNLKEFQLGKNTGPGCKVSETCECIQLLFHRGIYNK